MSGRGTLEPLVYVLPCDRHTGVVDGHTTMIPLLAVECPDCTVVTA